jgi:hypothetical protein
VEQPKKRIVHGQLITLANLLRWSWDVSSTKNWVQINPLVK